MIAYINQAADSGTVDSELKKQFNEECEYWTQVLQRVVTVVKFWAFSGTTSRWQMIRAGLQPNDNKRIETLKSLSDTRWSAHAVATKALCQNYAGIQQSLLNIADDDEHQNLSKREEARALHKKMNKLEIALMCNMWNDILQRFQGVSTALQAVELDLCNAVDLVQSLHEYVAVLRDQFDSYETAARNMSPIVSHEYKADTKRKKKRRRQADESSEPECELSGRKHFCTSVYIYIIDRLVSQLDRRYQSYKELCENFGFLNGLHLISPQDLRSAALSLQRKYNSNLEEDFVVEVVQFREFVQDENVSSTSALELLTFLRRRKLHTVFPNTDIALRLFLTMPVTNTSGEQSFSKLDLVKNRLRSSMQQDRVSHLTLMSIEHDILRDLDFKDIIGAFSSKKTRRKHF
ncbi:unnamed protein product [Leuciscus chuanchicus]